jgi:8-amino-7-oxononanoate synthase
MTLFQRWSDALETLKAQGRYRAFALPRGIDLTSNDYLGYGNGRPAALADASGCCASAPTPTRSVSEGLPRTGMSSRLLRGHHAVWEEVESALADWHAAEAVLMMTSGYAANEGLISTLFEPADWVATDELNHACIIDGLRLARCRRFSYRHNDLNHLEEGLKAEAAKGGDGRAMFVVTESLFSMDGDRAPLQEIADLAGRYGAHVIVDEAHSTGCFNGTGSGCVDEAGVRDRVLASVHTGGKALGVPGAYIVGSKLLKEYLVNRCRHLIFTTALPAACGRWWVEMLPKVKADGAGRRALHESAALLRSELSRRGVAAKGDRYVVPVVIGDDARAVAAARRLQERGYDIRAIRPPSVAPGTARLRVSVHADHDPAMLCDLAAAIAEVC